MGERKNNYSLPSNYLTLAQLQERWLKQQNQINRSESQHKGKNQNQNPQSPKQIHQKQPHLQVVARNNGSVPKSRPQMQYVVKNQKDSETNRRTTVVIESDRRESVTGSDNRDKTADLDRKASESKKKKKIRIVKPKPETVEREARGEGSGTTAQESEEGEASEKVTMESEAKEEKEKKGGSVRMDEIEERVRVSPVEERVKVLPVEERVKVLPVEERVRVLSINPKNEKQSGRLGKMNKGFGAFHRQGKNEGEANYGYGNWQQSKFCPEKTEKKMVWVRKDEIVGEIEN